MNKQLFIVGLILVLFIVIFWKQLKDAFISNSIENFSGISYPSDASNEGLMKLHNNFIIDSSTQYNKIITEMETLRDVVVPVTFTPPSHTPSGGVAFTQVDLFNTLVASYLTAFETVKNINDNAQNTNSVTNYKKDINYQLKIVLYIGLQVLKNETVDFFSTCTEDKKVEMISAPDVAYKFIELVCHFLTTYPTFKDKVKSNIKPKILEQFNSKYFSQKDLSERDKIAICKDLLFEFIKELYTLVYSTSDNNVACVLHSVSSCPNEPYTQIVDTDYADSDGNTRQVTSKAKPDRMKKFRCQVDKDAKICATTQDFKTETSNCNVMNGYGKEQCENTEYSGGDNVTLPVPKCRYDYFTEKCFNPTFTSDDAPDTFLSWDNTTGDVNKAKSTVDVSKCHLISNKTYCNQQTSGSTFTCQWKLDHNRCVPKKTVSISDYADADAEAVKFCHSLSMKKDEDGTTTNKEFIKGFTLCAAEDNGNGYYIGIKQGEEPSKRKQDGSEGVLDAAVLTDKPAVCAFIDANPVNDVKTQENLCRSFDCNFYKYPRYLPASSSEKHKFITKCLDKTTDNSNYGTYSPEIMSNKESCEKGGVYKWSDKAQICVDPSAHPEKCNILKNSKLCRLNTDCIWQSTGSYDESEGFERGFCKDLSPKFKKLLDVMDSIHNKHLAKYVKVTNLEEKLARNMPSFKNQLTSLK